MSEHLAKVIPLTEQGLVLRFGGDDPQRTRELIIAMYGFLIDKPQNTRRAYRNSIRQFFEVVGWKDPKSVTPAEASAYKRWLMERGYSNATVMARLAGIKSFYAYLCQPSGPNGEQLLTVNPFSFVSYKDVPVSPYGRSKILSWEEFQSMINALPTTEVGYRDRAVLIFAAYTGRRRAEIASLRVSDLDLKSNPRSYRVVVKGNRVQHFELPKICYDAIRAHWISANRLRSLRPDSGVFSAFNAIGSKNDITNGLDPERPISGRSVREIVERAARRAGLDPKRVTAHSLRHMAAADLDRGGARLQDIQRFLGHANPNTTAIYLQALQGPAPALEKELEKVRGAAQKLANVVTDIIDGVE